MSKSDTERAEPPANEPKPTPPKRGHKRDRVARYLVANDVELYTKGVGMLAIADACDCSTATVRAGRGQVKTLTLFWYPRRWPKLRSDPLVLFPKEWSPIRDRLLTFADRLPANSGIGLRTLSPDFAMRWLVENRKCDGLTLATVAEAGRSIGWKW